MVPLILNIIFDATTILGYLGVFCIALNLSMAIVDNTCSYVSQQVDKIKNWWDSKSPRDTSTPQAIRRSSIDSTRTPQTSFQGQRTLRSLDNLPQSNISELASP